MQLLKYLKKKKSFTKEDVAILNHIFEVAKKYR